MNFLKWFIKEPTEIEIALKNLLIAQKNYQDACFYYGITHNDDDLETLIESKLKYSEEHIKYSVLYSKELS